MIDPDKIASVREVAAGLDLSRLDLERLKGDVAPLLAEALEGLVHGAKADVEAYAKQITDELLAATLTGDREAEAQLLDQLKLLAEINRLRVENHALTVVGRVTRMVFKAATAGAVAALL